MPDESAKLNGSSDIKVFLCNARGMFLAQDANGLFFSNDRSVAIVLNYKSDRVEEQLDALRATHGIVLKADPVPVGEIYETCDRCKELFMPWMTHFDGQRFLCADCRKLAASKPSASPRS